jgi:predicted DNA-binding protein (MmcQ/YjbR family)
MNGQDVLRWCRAQVDVSEERPFGPETIVFKVHGHMFAACPAVADPNHITLKGDPGLSETLREQYPAIKPGYHLNKRHWNTIDLDGTVPGEVLTQLLGDSYRLVVGSPKRTRAPRS